MSPITKPLFFVLCFLTLGIFLPSKVEAQKNKKKEGELTILKKVPEFFINDNFMPPKLKAIYKRDAARIALRLINQEQRISQQSIEIPEQLLQGVYNALVAIRVSEIPCVDTISEKYNIRTFANTNVTSLTLVFDQDADWVKPLKMRADTTGNPALNNIFRKYNLRISRMAYLDEERAGLILIAKEPLNISALSRKFFLEEGIGCIEEMQTYGDGSDIDMQLTDEGWTVTYSAKFGNCLKQCSKKYEWKFSVSKGGQVTFISGGGDTIPPWFAAGDKKRIETPDIIKGAKDGKTYYQDKGVQDKIKKQED